LAVSGRSENKNLLVLTLIIANEESVLFCKNLAVKVIDALIHWFKKLPRAQSLEEIEQLLPWHVDKEQINNGWAKKVDGV